MLSSSNFKSVLLTIVVCLNVKCSPILLKEQESSKMLFFDVEKHLKPTFTLNVYWHAISTCFQVRHKLIGRQTNCKINTNWNSISIFRDNRNRHINIIHLKNGEGDSQLA